MTRMSPDRARPARQGPTAVAGLTGIQVGHYLVGDPLGSGGMGDVYRGEDTRLGRAVALKFLKEGRDDPAERQRLLREARAASTLRSSNIAAIYDLGEYDTRPFIVMELVEGEPLSARIARSPLAIADAVGIAAQAADALDEAHTHHIVHRDIKSANLMVDQRNRVKLLDFGLARYADPADVDALTRTGIVETVVGTVMGTFAYMSPEQVRGRPLDGRSDIFSLGIVLYEMLTGRLPFDGRSVTDVADRILNHEPPALARFNYGVPDALETIVLKALEKDLSYRYQSARELFIDLRHVSRALEQGDVPAPDVDTSARALVRRTRTLRPASGGSLRARTAELVAPISHPDADYAVAVMTFSNTTREPADDWIGAGIAETVTADLKGVRGLTVLSRAQVFDAIKHLSGTDLAQIAGGQAIDIGRRIGATFIVGGGYQRLGSRIRITVECVDVRSGELVRTLKLDGAVDDLFSLQDRIVSELRQELDHESSGQLLASRAHRGTESIEAFQAFSRGMMNLRLATLESLQRAASLFEAALGIDPDYAAAWAALGTTFNLQGQFLGVHALRDKALDAFKRALAIDPDEPYALAGLGGTYAMLGRTAEAESLLQRAIELDPANPVATLSLARLYWVGQGRFDAGLEQLERALERNPDAGYVHAQIALLSAILGDLPRAERAALTAVGLQESLKSGTDGLQMIGSFVRLGYVRYLQGRYDEAIAEYERERDFLGRHDHALKERTLIEIAQKTGTAAWRMGDRDAAERSFDEALRGFRGREARGASDPFTTFYMAAIHALRGDADQALALLVQAGERLPALTRARVLRDPDFEGFRERPDVQQWLALPPPLPEGKQPASLL